MPHNYVKYLRPWSQLVFAISNMKPFSWHSLLWLAYSLFFFSCGLIISNNIPLSLPLMTHQLLTKAICIFFLLLLLPIIHQLNLLSEYVGCYLPKIFITNQWRPKHHLIRFSLYFIWCLQSHITRDALIY